VTKLRAVPLRPIPEVAAAAAPEADVDATRVELGRRIALLREERGLSVRALGDAASITGSFISQIEHGHVMPSVASLIRIAGALGVSVGDLFDKPAATGRVRHPGERTVYRYDEHGVRDEILSDDPSGEIEVLRSHIEPGGGTGDEIYTHGTRVEVVYVLAGDIEVALGAQRLRLTAGDSLTFTGDVPHGVWNRGSVTAELMWIVNPAAY
jgi:transcriptional regulator with XRE-family HTH domain